MFNKRKFMAAIAQKGMNVEEVAKRIGMTASTLYRKMNGKSDFYRDEIQLLCEVLDIDDPIGVFFANQIA